MIRKQAIARDQAGAATVEIALTLPILLLFIYGIFQIGVILAANAGMQHALGEGARYATLFPTPSNELIQARINDKKFGVHVGIFGTPTVSDPPAGESGYRDLAVTYSVTPNFLFFNGPAITFTRTKRVYLPS